MNNYRYEIRYDAGTYPRAVFESPVRAMEWLRDFYEDQGEQDMVLWELRPEHRRWVANGRNLYFMVMRAFPV